MAADAAVPVRRQDRQPRRRNGASDLLGRLIADQDRAAVKANPAPAVFIAEALDLCLAKKYAVPDALKEGFRRLALDAIEDEVELQARQALGLCLGRLGDPRIFDLRDPAAYVEVPAGTYPYGDEGKTVEIAAPFRIGRYPVTNSQYRSFHRRRRLPRATMVVGGRLGMAAGRRRSPSPGSGATGAGTARTSRWWGSASGRPRRAAPGPAGGCRENRNGRPPPAARTAMQYPWGNDWQDGICNSAEAGLGVTSPVGLFPRARQAELGIEDLAGNVWEWCDSLYDPLTSRTGCTRVLRGGSWDDYQDGARSAFRGWSPDSRDYRHRLSGGVFVAHQRTLSADGRRASAALRFVRCSAGRMTSVSRTCRRRPQLLA